MVEKPILNPDGKYRDIQDAAASTQKRKFQNQEQYRNFVRSGADPYLPQDPNIYYTLEQWIYIGGWDGYLGREPPTLDIPPDHRWSRKTPQKAPAPKPKKAQAPKPEKVPEPKPVVAEKPPEPPTPDPPPVTEPAKGPKMVRRSTFKHVSFRDSGYDDD